jgi:hypothetical protein
MHPTAISGGLDWHRRHLWSCRHLADHVRQNPLADQHYDREMAGRRLHARQRGLPGNLDFKLDGKEYTPKGPRVPPGMTVTAKRIDHDTLELTYKLKGKTTETDKYELSSYGKILTQTVTYAGVSKPEVDVWDRE